MSSIPGYTLEAFVEWQWNLVVMDDQPDSNFSMMMAELINSVQPRPRLTKEQFAPILALYEPYRETIEDRLLDFDEENQSWRSYAEHVDSEIPEDVVAQINAAVKTAIAETKKEKAAHDDMVICYGHLRPPTTIRGLRDLYPNFGTYIAESDLSGTTVFVSNEGDSGMVAGMIERLKELGANVIDEPHVVVDSIPSDFVLANKHLEAYDDKVKRPRSQRIPHMKRGGFNAIRNK